MLMKSYTIENKIIHNISKRSDTISWNQPKGAVRFNVKKQIKKEISEIEFIKAEEKDNFNEDSFENYVINDIILDLIRV